MSVNVFHSPEISHLITTPVLLEQMPIMGPFNKILLMVFKFIPMIWEDRLLWKHAFKACQNLRHTTWLTISAESWPVILKTSTISANAREGINGLEVNDRPSLTTLAKIERNSLDAMNRVQSPTRCTSCASALQKISTCARQVLYRVEFSDTPKIPIASITWKCLDIVLQKGLTESKNNSTAPEIAQSIERRRMRHPSQKATVRYVHWNHGAPCWSLTENYKSTIKTARCPQIRGKESGVIAQKKIPNRITCIALRLQVVPIMFVRCPVASAKTPRV